MSNSITIPLSKNGKNRGKYEAIIDSIDADLMEYSWSVQLFPNRTLRYAKRGVMADGKIIGSVQLHRAILIRMLEREITRDEQVDHIDGNGLNNKRCNLRLANNTQNQGNAKKRRDNTTGYKGVNRTTNGKFMATIRINKKKRYLGIFNTAKAAHKAYCEAASRHYGEFANSGE